MKLKLREDLPPRDVETVLSEGLIGEPEGAISSVAQRETRVLVT
jgi:hypothetical protein